MFDRIEDRVLLSTVTTTADDGPGSLRVALATATTGELIDFAIPNTDPGYSPATGSWTISVLSSLPTPTSVASITIDGFTQQAQPGASTAHPVIRLTAGGGFTGDGLAISTNSNTIRGLVINGFQGYGISLAGLGDDNLITGNYIGTDVTGTTAVPNALGGILMVGVLRNTIGGTTESARNIISGNGGDGIVIDTSDGIGGTNLVAGNSIGVGASGTGALGNAGDGVRIFSSFNTIGGTATGAGNIIANNTGRGISVEFGIGNVLLSNSIFNNGGVGIALISGGNNNQPAPTLTSALLFADRAVIQGTFDVVADTSYLIQFFGNNPASNQGRTLLGSQAIAAQASPGTVSVGLTLAPSLPAGSSITAIASVTAVPPSPSIPAQGDTSAFSTAVFLVNPFIVTNTRDFDPGSLRFAIDTANADVANDNRITFAIPTTDEGYDPTTGSWRIGVFPDLTINKPTSGGVQRTVTIDGFSQQSQPGAATNHPVIEITPGFFAAGGPSATGDGLTILTGGNTVLGLVLNGFSNNGIYIAPGANGNRIAGNFLGTDVTGTTAVPNDGSGVSVFSANNTIGGLTPTARNLISGNGLDGIGLTNAAATGNVVQGNYIGTDITGTNRLGNSRFGVAVNSVVGSGSASGSGNTIGGTGAGAGNVISANGSHGVVLNGPDGGATGNLVQGNLIGTDASGLLNLGNGGSGLVLSSAGSNTVGGTSAAARNVIAGSGRYGLVIEEASSSNNVILGNFIGTDGVGTAALGNALAGLIIQLGATGNTVGGAAGGGNLISGNLQGGVVITGVGTRANIVAANRIGTTANGQAALGNANNGVSIASGASGNTIGGTGESGNVISGNRGDGVSVNATGSVVQGNLIGLDSAGTAAVPNGVAGSGTGGAGVRLGAPSNLITDNVISGNVNEGMFVQSQANQQQILGNRIGTNAAGTLAIGNGLSGITLNQSSGNTINANVLSGNGVLPIGGVGLIAVAGSNNNLIQGNRVGTDLAGTRALPNSGGGLFIASVGNTIGGAGAGARNILSGNQGNGLVLSNNSGNSILNNFVGIASDGATPLGNSVDGLALNNSTGNVISGNVVSGNGVNLDGVGINLQNNSRNNTIAGNRVGTNAAGDAAVRNALHGIFLGNGSVNNTIGGPNAADRNIISGNGSFPVADLLTQGSVGVFISGAGSTGNVIAGNFIGTSADGNQPLTSSVIGVLIDQSPGNIVRGNLISGNRFVGLEIAGATASGNLVQGNLIGTNLAGNGAIPNRFDGVFLNGAPGNTIGGPGAGEGNLISGNGSVGIQLFGAATQGNVIQGNAIGLDSAGRPTLPNRSGGIFINGGATSNQIGGTAPGEANLGQSRPLGNFSPPRQSLQQSSKGMARLRLSRRSPVLRARPGFSARRLRPAH